jgi:ribose transport system ATP-binding protein
LSEKEVKILFDLIRSLKENGVSIVYISHRMNEIFEIGDRITVFRDGCFIDTVNASETTEDELVKMIIGREFDNSDSTSLQTKRELKLQVENVSVGKFDATINIDAYAGEILGIFGLIGSGRTELARVIFGIDSVEESKIKKDGKVLNLKSPYDAIKNGIGLIPEDRKEVGLITMHNVRDNITLIKLNELPWVRPSHSDETKIAEVHIKKTSIATRGPRQLTKYLSGGNQQKVVISKWLAVDMDVLILDEPTRGVDVGAKSEIYAIIRELAAAGKCIILISSDLPEILRVCQRVLVMHDGAVTLDDKVENLDQEKIMRAALS